MSQFSAASIQSALGDHPWANRIVFYESTDSTNTQAKRLAAEGAPHGTVLVAAHQTAGRGRLGRQFHSPDGVGIYMSIILRPNCRPEQLMHLTCAAGVAACEAVERTLSFRPGIKWINDLVYGNQKLAGILAELLFDAEGNVDTAIIGIGINCNQRAEDFPPELRSIAISAAMITGQITNRSQLTAALILAMADMADNLYNQKQILEAYRHNCITIGQTVSVHRGDFVRHATALSVDNEGGLVVRYDNGEITTVTSGEVSVRGMYGYV